MDDDLRFASVDDVATRLGVSRRTVYYKIALGELPPPIADVSLFWLDDMVRASCGLGLPGDAAESKLAEMMAEMEADRSRKESRYTPVQRLNAWKTIRALNRQSGKAKDARLCEIQEAAASLKA